MKNVFLTISLLLLLTTYGLSQLINEEFNTSLPPNWTQGGAITWGYNSDFNCAQAYLNIGPASSGWLQTPTVNLTTIANPNISFKVASIRNNFTAPNISLWYDTGSGWQFLQRWGSGAGTTPITQTNDFLPPLDSSNVTWVTVNYDLSTLATNTNIRFSFGADINNGGWVLVDSVVLYEVPAPTVYTLPYLQDFEGSIFLPQDWEAFGGTNAVWQQSTTVGGFGNSTQSAYFDNLTTPNVAGNFYGMRSVLLNLMGASQPTLEFDVAYAQPNNNVSDRLGIWYSFNGQTGWQNLVNYNFANLSTAPNQTSFFTPSSLQWETKTISLSAFVGTPLIRFAFENNSSGGNAVYIDNVHFYDAALTNNTKIPEVNQLKAFPNPFSTEFTLNNAENIESISVYNPIGIKIHEAIFTKGESQIRIDAIKNHPAQTYLLIAKTFDGRIINYTMIKN